MGCVLTAFNWDIWLLQSLPGRVYSSGCLIFAFLRAGFGDAVVLSLILLAMEKRLLLFFRLQAFPVS